MLFSNRRKLAVYAFVVLVSCGLIVVKQRHCTERNAVFRKQVEVIKKDASDQLRTGANHADVIQFFAEHHIPVTFAYSLASGSIQATGCSPVGCGADSATITVTVEVDQQGTVVGKPLVSGIYNDCL